MEKKSPLFQLCKNKKIEFILFRNLEMFLKDFFSKNFEPNFLPQDDFIENFNEENLIELIVNLEK